MEQIGSEYLYKLGLADAGRPGEYKRYRFAFIAYTGTRTLNGTCDCLILTDNALFQPILKPLNALELVFTYRGSRNTRPHFDNRGKVVSRQFNLFAFGFKLLELIGNRQFFRPYLGDLLILLLGLLFIALACLTFGIFTLAFQLQKPVAQLICFVYGTA